MLRRVQLIVAGPTSVTVQAEGAVEGQQKIRAYDMRPDTMSIQAFIASLIGASLFAGGFIYAGRKIDKRKKEGRVAWKLQLLATAGTLLGLALLFVSISYISSSAVPPAFR